MAAQALYLKYRPQTFEEVVGQEPITRTLRNALRQGRIRHAYLFTGPRGTGKTTTARLLAKAVNCQAPQAERPCNACPLCRAVNEGRLLDLIEIDAASNRGIDEIRDIREKVSFRPGEGRFKVYVLDEAHMLTEPAFNALLKTLEEPPPHVIFTLVTTDPHKIPATITSRCQRFDFKRIPLRAIVDRLAAIAAQEGLTVEPAALELIARQGGGALRDAISLLDQLASYGHEISLEQVQMVSGATAGEVADRMATCLAEGDVAGGLELINRALEDGADPRQLGREVVEYLRGLLLVKEGAGTRLLNTTAEQAARMEALAGRMPGARLLRALRLFNEAANDLKSGLQTIPQLPLEMALVESLLEQAAPMAAPSPSVRQEEARPAPLPTGPGGTPLRPAAPEAAAQQPIGQPAPTPRPAPPAGDLAPTGLEQIRARWDEIINEVYAHNRMTAAVLRSNCQVVDLVGDELVLSFISDPIRQKLKDQNRRLEVEEALHRILNCRYRLKLVLASEYTPRQPAPPAHSEPAPSGPPLDDQALDQISRWAAERGGRARIVEP